MENNKGKIIKSCFTAAGLTLAAIVIIFGINRTLPGGDRTFIYGDAIIQYIPIIKMFLRHLFSGESMIYSFEAGMGMPTVALYAYYCMSPFNFLLLLINGPDIACFVLFTAKLVSASAAMAFLLSKKGNISTMTVAVLSNAYVLCGFVLNFSFGIIFFDMMILMPFLLLALIHFVKTKRMIPLCITYALCFIIHFYSGYMLGVFSFVLFLCLGAEEYGKDAKRWLNGIFRYGICVLIAALISAPVLFPTAMELFGHLGSDSTVLDNLRLSVLDFLICFYPGLTQSAYNSVPMLYFGLLPLIMYILFLLNREKSLREKLLAFIPLGFLLVCSFWKPAYLMIHAFDAPDGYCFRFSWLFGFWIIYVSAEEFERRIKRKGALAIGAALIILYFLIYIIQIYIFKGDTIADLSNGVLAAAFLIMYSAVLFLGDKSRNMLMIMNLLFLAETLCNGVVMGAVFTNDKTQDGNYYKIWREQSDNAMRYIEGEEAKDRSEFYRVCYGNAATENIAMLYGFRGIEWFLSIENENVRSLMETLGYATSSRKALDYGATDVTRMLFSQKYTVQCGSYYGEHPEYYSVIKNDRTLPPVFLVSDKALGLELVKKKPFAAQNQLADALMGEECRLWQISEDPYRIQTENMNWTPYDGGFFIERESEENFGKMLISFDDNDYSQLYVYVSREPASGDDPNSPLLFSDVDLGGLNNRPRLFMPRIIPASRNDNGEWECSLYMPEWGYGLADYKELYNAVLDEQELDRLYSSLSEGGMELSYVSESKLSGTINVKDDKTILLTTIPYDDGWEIYVDGERAESIRLLEGAFLGTALKKGEHELQICFHNRWLIPGGIIGVVGLGGLLAVYLTDRKKALAD